MQFTTTERAPAPRVMCERAGALVCLRAAVLAAVGLSMRGRGVGAGRRLVVSPADAERVPGWLRGCRRAPTRAEGVGGDPLAPVFRTATSYRQASCHPYRVATLYPERAGQADSSPAVNASVS